MLKAWPAKADLASRGFGARAGGDPDSNRTINGRSDAMLKVALWVVVAMFVIGLLVVFGVLDFIF